MSAPPETESLVTIVIPVFNGADYLAAAIDSALAQSRPAIEVLVVDDGSSDNGRTRTIAESYGDRIRLVSKPNGGVATALNAGIAAMRGRWFSWLSHDDLYHPRKVETQLRALRQAGPDSFAFGDYELIDADGSFMSRVEATRGFDSEAPLWSVLEGRINGCTMLVPRAMLEEAGGFHPGLPTTQDYELWFRLARRYRLLGVPGALVRHRVHERQGSRTLRHAEEAGLLWTEMLRSLTAQEMLRHAPSEIAFLARAAAFLARSGYAAGRATVARMKADRLRDVPLTLLWAGTGPCGPASVLAALTGAGLGAVRCVVADFSPDATASFALRQAVPPGVRVVRIEAGDMLMSIFGVLRAAGMGRVVLLADAATQPDPAEFREGLVTIESRQADAWLSAETRAPAGDGAGCLPAAFRGALLARDAVDAAFVRCATLGTSDATAAIGLVARIAHKPGLRPASPSPASASVLPARRSAPRLAEPPGGQTPGGQSPGGQSPGGQSPGGQSPGGQSPGGQLPGGQLPGPPWLVPASGLPMVRPRRLAGPGPRPDLATTRLGIWLLDRATRLHRRVPPLRGRVGPIIAWSLGARGLVDPPAYLEANPDLAAAGVDPLLHYLRHGWREHRDPRPRIAQNAAGGQTEYRSDDPDHDAQPRIKPAVVAATSAGARAPNVPPARLLLLHAAGGGTLRYAELLSAHLRRHGERPVFAWGVGDRRLCVSVNRPDIADLTFDLPDGLAAAAAQLRAEGVVRADVLHTLDLETHVEALLQALAVPYDVTFLDYHLVATTPHLIDPEGSSPAIGRADEANALAPLVRPSPHPILRNATRRLACSRDLAARLERLVPGLGALPVRPPEPEKPHAFRVTPPALLGSSEPLRVLLLGHLAPHKGRELVLAAAAEVGKRGLPLEFHVLGPGDPPVPPEGQLRGPLYLYGPFVRTELAALIAAIHPHLAWFPADAPETFGFTLSEAMSMGLPILARGMGAYPERLARREFTWVVPPAEDASATAWIDRLLALRDSNLRAPSQAPEPAGLPPLQPDFYAADYLAR